MNTTKPTPGPWRTKRSVNQMCDEATTITSVGGSDRSHEPRWWIFSDAETHGDAEADARLIAAAPELLEALEVLIDVAPRSISEHGQSPWQKARDAIAKATGAKETQVSDEDLP